MRRYSGEAEKTVQAADLIREWMGSGLLEKEQIPRLSEDLQTDLRRTNNFLRLVLFLFTAIIIGASVLLLIDILKTTEIRAKAVACAAAAALCFGLAECLVARFRVYRFGVEEALGAGAVVLVIAAVALMMSNANIDSILAMALAIGAVGGLLLYLRFGFVYAGVIAIACAAMIPFPLVHPVIGRHLLSAAVFLVIFGLFLMIAAVWIRRWLSRGSSGARFGFTPARILNRDSRLMTVVSTASAAFQPQASPSAPAVTETAKPEFAGGRSGGAGASGEF